LTKNATKGQFCFRFCSLIAPALVSIKHTGVRPDVWKSVEPERTGTDKPIPMPLSRLISSRCSENLVPITFMEYYFLKHQYSKNEYMENNVISLEDYAIRKSVFLLFFQSFRRLVVTL
jgi:hypothetical protein